MLSKIRNMVADALWLGAARKHRSRMGWRDAPRYTRYLDKARKQYSARPDAVAAKRGEHFREHGWSSFTDNQTSELARSILAKIKAEEGNGLAVWSADGRYQLGDLYQKFPEVEAFFRGPTGDFLRATYGANFKIFYGVCYRSEHAPSGPSGSQLWHADGGPGTCINLMWCLSPVSKENGAMECLNWQDTIQIFEGERGTTRGMLTGVADRMDRRSLLTEYYRNAIEQRFQSSINQPTGHEGLIFAFSNNTIHKGGYPQPGHERYVCVFHIYPSVVPTPYEAYGSKGIAKKGSNPQDPAFGDVP